MVNKKVTKKEEIKEHNPIDKFFNDIFSDSDLVKDFLVNLVEKDFIKKLDFSTLKKEDRRVLNKSKKDRTLDFLWNVSYLKNPEMEAYICIHLEVQSTNDNRMPIRFLNYIASWYDNNYRTLNKGDKIIPIIPILFYVDKNWNAETSFHDLVDIPDEEMKPYIPSFEYIKVMLDEIDAKKLEEANSILTQIFMFSKVDSENEEEFERLVKKFFDLLCEEREEKYREYLNYLYEFLSLRLGTGIDEEVAEKIINKVRKGDSMEASLLFNNYVQKNTEKKIAQRDREIVIEMIKEFLTISKIAKITKLSKEQIKKIAKEENLTDYLSK